MNGYTRNFRVRPEVRQRVIDAAIELKYKPNPMVRSIAAKQTNIVAILGSMRNEEMDAAVRAAVRVLNDAGKHVCTSFLDPETSAFVEPSWRVDGAIAIRPDSDETLRALADRGVPCVSIDGRVGIGDSVCIDEDAGVRLAFERLHAGGHDSIVYASLGEEWKPRTRGSAEDERHDAYASLCEARASVPVSIASERDAARVLGEVCAHDDAGVIAADSPSAMRLLQIADRLGIRSPDRLSIVCLGDPEMASLATPALTCVRPPLEEIGRVAAGLLLERLSAPADSPPAEARRERLAGVLVERDSTLAMQPG